MKQKPDLTKEQLSDLLAEMNAEDDAQAIADAIAQAIADREDADQLEIEAGLYRYWRP